MNFKSIKYHKALTHLNMSQDDSDMFYLKNTKFYLPNLLGIPSQPPGIVCLVFSPHQVQQ